MFRITAHVKPKKKSKNYDTIKGAYAVLFIDFKDVDGAFQLAKYYFQLDDWKIKKLDKTYYKVRTKEEMGDEYMQYYNEVKEGGYSLIFNTYPKKGKGNSASEKPVNQ